MSSKALLNWFKARIGNAALAGTDVFPNVDADAGVRPRHEVMIATRDRDGGPVKGNVLIRETGIVTVICVIDQNGGEDDAQDMADAVVALFPEGQEGNFTGGRVKVLGPPSVGGGYAGEADWRVPVSIRYRARLD